MTAAYEGSMLYGEHTWGFDAKAFPRLYGEAWEEALAAGRYARLIESWAGACGLHPRGRRRGHESYRGEPRSPRPGCEGRRAADRRVQPSSLAARRGWPRARSGLTRRLR